MKKSFRIIVALLAGAFCLQGCLYEEDDIFEESPSARLQARLDSTKTILQAQKYGWVMDVYPEEDQSYGGYVFTMKFHGDSVDVQTELATDITEPLSSLYKTNNNDGATLSFDTYNEYFHYFSTPTTYRYTAYQGEFEFIICDVKPNLIKLKGAKTGNIMYLRALDMPATDYIVAAKNMDKYFQKLLPTIGDDDTQVEIHTFQRYAYVKDMSTGEVSSVAVCPTATGLRFYSGVEFNCGKVSEVVPVEDADGFEGVKDIDTGKTIDWVKPEGWEAYDEMVFEKHSWKLHAQICTPEGKLQDVAMPVTFRRGELDGVKGYYMDGIWETHPVFYRYLRREGKLDFIAYQYGTTDSKDYPYFYVCPARQAYEEVSITSFYIADYYEDQGMMWASDYAGSYDYVNNGVYPDYDYDCLCVKVFDETLTSFKYITTPEWRIIGTDDSLSSGFGCFLFHITKLERVN